MRLALLVTLMAGVAVAVQTSLTSAAQKVLGPVGLVAVSGFTTGAVALMILLLTTRPEVTGRAVLYGVCSGFLGAFIVGSIAFSAGQQGIARTLSLVIASQLIVGLVLDSLGWLGTAADFSLLKAAGVALIITGGVLVVRF